MSFWKKQKVVVTGGAGFLGSFVCEKLQKAGVKELFVPRSSEYDLREKEAIVRLLQETKPTLVIHLAGSVGGIGANRKNPGKFFYDNAIMGIQLMECARQLKVGKFVVTGTVCAYPQILSRALSRKGSVGGLSRGDQCTVWNRQKDPARTIPGVSRTYGFNSIFLLPVNLYGPGDNFDPESSHVIPALIRKCIEANRSGQPWIECWGTGTATGNSSTSKMPLRGSCWLPEHYDRSEPVNLGAASEISIKDLTESIARLTVLKAQSAGTPTTRMVSHAEHSMLPERSRSSDFEPRWVSRKGSNKRSSGIGVNNRQQTTDHRPREQRAADRRVIRRIMEGFGESGEPGSLFHLRTEHQYRYYLPIFEML